MWIEGSKIKLNKSLIFFAYCIPAGFGCYFISKKEGGKSPLGN